MRIRTTARWVLVPLAAGALLGTLQLGSHGVTTVARAQQPDVYQVSAAAAGTDTRNYQTGSAVDPAPAVNTAVPYSTILADNAPKVDAHAAYAEPPQVAQAATGLNNVPVPYPTQAEALCANCAGPVIRNADGNTDQQLSGSRISTGGGHAHAEAAPLAGSADASNGHQAVGPDDQVANLYNAAVFDVYSQVINKPAPSASPKPPAPPSQLSQPPGCQALPTPGPLGKVPPASTHVCPAQLPLTNVLASSAATETTSTATTDANGTIVDAVSVVGGTQILDGLVTIGLVRVEVRASGDGAAADSHIVATNDIERVCVGLDCSSYSLTAQGLCKIGLSAYACTNDPINQQLRKNGLNVCRLGTATSGEKTQMLTGGAMGVLVEFHATGTAKGGYTPDAHYYDNQPGICGAASPTPRPGYSGISSFTVIGESSVQLLTRSFQACTRCQTPPPPAPSQSAAPATVIINNGGSSTTIINNGGGGSGGVGQAGASAATTGIGTPQVATTAASLRERRPLVLAAFGLLEIVLLGNLTIIARSRRSIR